MGRRKLLFIILAALLGTVLFLYFENNSIVVTMVELRSKQLPAQFDGFKIVHISDLHGKRFGRAQQGLFGIISDLKPDIIVFTGDLIDSNHPDEEAGLTLFKRSTNVAPVYYVTGNHEWWAGTFDTLATKLETVGVKVLQDASTAIRRKGASIYILGIDDIAKQGDLYNADIATQASLKRALKGIADEDYKILLAHRPELFSVYSDSNIDVVLSGHAHGGQVRLPLIGGLVAPDQGFLPKYTAGVYSRGLTKMVVNRGLGNSIVPQRIFNRPEVVIITLKR